MRGVVKKFPGALPWILVIIGWSMYFYIRADNEAHGRMTVDDAAEIQGVRNERK